MRQYAPYPDELYALVVSARYRPGWTFSLVDVERDPADTHGAAAGGLTLVITTKTADSRHTHLCETCQSPVTDYRVRFAYIVPAATYDRATWLEWLMDRVEETELHEARENFRLVHMEAVGEGQLVGRTEWPMAPNHGPGRDPGRRYAYATDQDRRTSFRGQLNPE